MESLGNEDSNKDKQVANERMESVNPCCNLGL